MPASQEGTSLSGRIPLDHTPFIGRVREMDCVVEALDAGARLLSLIGAPGTGKSRFARELARRRIAHGGATHAGHCDLDGIDEAAEVAGAIAKALAIDVRNAASAEEVLSQIELVLATRGPTVLVLDSVGRSGDGARQVITQLLEHVDGLQILVVSRVRLGLAGAQTVEIGPLEQQEALHLFVDRASRARDYPSQSQFDLLIETVNRLDRLPLALELAAVRLTVLSTRDLLKYLRQQGSLGRHGALRQAFDWSMSRLTPEARTAWVLASVFPGGFDLAAAEAIIAPSLSAGLGLIDVLAELKDHCLLYSPEKRNPDGGLRFEMLGCVREYALELLNDSDLAVDVDALHERFVDHFVARAEAWAKLTLGPQASGGRDWLDLEHPNILAAIDRALPTRPHVAGACLLAWWRLIGARGPLRPFDERAERACGLLSGRTDTDVGNRLRVVLGRINRRRGLTPQALADFELAEACALDCEQRVAASEAAYHMARLYLEQVDTDSAGECIARCSEYAVALDDDGMGLAASILRARLLLAQGREVEAAEIAEQALARSLASLDPSYRGRALLVAGETAWRTGRHHDARSRFAQAGERFVDAGDQLGQSRVLSRQGRLALQVGELDQAEELLRKAARLQRELGELHQLGVTNRELACAAIERCRPELAERLLADAVDAHVLGYPRELGRDVAVRGLLWLERGMLSRATDDLTRAASLMDVQARPREAGIYLLLACAVATRADDERGLEWLTKGLRHLATDCDDEARSIKAALGGALNATRPNDEPPVSYSESVESSFLIRAAERIAWSLKSEPGEQAPRDPQTLEIESEGRWFRVGEAPPVDCSRRGAMRRILLALADRHRTDPGVGLSTSEVFEAGWPGTHIGWSSARNRTYVAVRRLRTEGLEGLLVSGVKGYALSSDCRVTWAQ